MDPHVRETSEGSVSVGPSVGVQRSVGRSVGQAAKSVRNVGSREFPTEEDTGKKKKNCKKNELATKRERELRA